MERISNEQKAKELAFKSLQCQMYIDNKCNQNFPCDRYNVALKMAQWKDEQHAEFLLELKEAFESLAQMCDKLTSGNVAHERPHLKGFAKGWAEITDEYLEKMKGE